MYNEPKINEKIIDGHLHIEAWENDEIGSFIDAFESYREGMDLNGINLCALNNHASGVANNIMMALYKIAHKDTFAHGCLHHTSYPISENVPEGMDLVTQYKEMMEIGFDGIKLIEGKPTCLKPLGGTLLFPTLDRFFAEAERDGTHIVFHVNDPDEFWDLKKAPQWAIDCGWTYTDGTYPDFWTVVKEIETILDKYPKLNVTFAHFFFYAKYPDKLEALFEKYKNMAVDITPGGEMYLAFESNHDFYVDFFKKHSNRILVGTDATFPWESYTHAWCIDRLYHFIATDKVQMAYCDQNLTGLNLSGKDKENILYANFERRVGEKPKEINKEKLLAYFEKYKVLFKDGELEKLNPLVDKYLR